MQFQNVADTEISASDAAASIVSQIRAFGENAEFGSHVIDAYNEVANNFSVGTNDISNAMEIASAGMATYGNSFEQIIGLVTAGTEIMTGRSSQVARGLNTIAANITANQGLLQQYGITVSDANGELKSTYDVLSELKPVWDKLNDSEKVALGQKLAGKNQYKVLASVMQNFGQAAEATKTALEATGSAAEENDRYMGGLEAKVTGVQAAFQKMANAVVGKGLVAGILDIGEALANFGSTDLGSLIAQITLLSGLLIGGAGILKAGRYTAVGKEIIGVVKTIIGGFQDIAGAAAIASTGVSSFTGALAVANPALATFITTAAPIIAGIAAIAGLVAIAKAIDANIDSLENLRAKIAEVDAQIEEKTNTEEYKELISKVGELNNAEKTRLAVLQEETAELERQRAILKQQEYEAFRKGQRRGRGGDEYGFGAETYYASDEAANELRASLVQLEVQFSRGQITTYDYRNSLTALASKYGDLVSSLQDYSDNGIELTAQEKQLIFEYQLLQGVLGHVIGQTGGLTDANQELADSFEEAADAKARFDNLLAGGDFDDAIKSAQEVFKEFNSELANGDIASQRMIAALTAMGINLNDVGYYGMTTAEKIAYLHKVQSDYNAVLGESDDPASKFINFLDKYKNIAESGVLEDGAGGLSVDVEALSEMSGISTEVLEAGLEAIRVKGLEIGENADNAGEKLEDVGETDLSDSAAVQGVGTLNSALGVAADTADSVKNALTELGKTTVTATIKIKTIGGGLLGGLDHNASGTDNAPGGLSLVNEEGAELIVDKDRAYIAGGGKETITYLPKGASVYTAKETKQLLSGGTIQARANGVGGGSKYIINWQDVVNNTPQGGGGGSVSAPSSRKSDEDVKKEFEKLLKAKKHALAMDEITEEEYYKWLEEANEKYFANRKNLQDEYWKYQEEIYKWQKEQLEDIISLEEKLNDLAKAKTQKVLVMKDGIFQYVNNVESINKAQTALSGYNGAVALENGEGVKSATAFYNAPALGNYGGASANTYGDTFNIGEVRLENVNDVDSVFNGLKNLAIQTSTQ